MRRLIVAVTFLVCAYPVAAEETLAEFVWSKLQAEGKLGGVSIVPAGEQGPFESLVVGNPEGLALETTVLAVQNPKIGKNIYGICGQVRYEGVEGKAYLEMWNVFPGGGRYFTRTLASSGPLQSLTGSSAWRPFVLPFFIGDKDKRPEQIVLNIVLPGKGKVWLSPVRLVQYEGKENPLAAPGQWWTDRQGGWIGGMLGGLFGCLGALIGVLGGRGKARGFVLGALKAMVVIGLASLGFGIVAAVCSQSYAVCYPPLLLGTLLTAVPIGLSRPLRRRYEQLELRRIEAMDRA